MGGYGAVGWVGAGALWQSVGDVTSGEGGGWRKRICPIKLDTNAHTHDCSELFVGCLVVFLFTTTALTLWRGFVAGDDRLARITGSHKIPPFKGT